MGNKVISLTIYKVWIPFTILGIFTSVLVDKLISQFFDLGFLGQAETYSAVWCVVLGLALMRLEAIMDDAK